MFDDAAELVELAGKMMKRGLGSSKSSSSTPKAGSVGTPSTTRTRNTPRMEDGEGGLPDGARVKKSKEEIPPRTSPKTKTAASGGDKDLPPVPGLGLRNAM